MAGDDVVERVLDGYLDAVSRQLVGPRGARAAILDELRDGLLDAVAVGVRRGHGSAAARHAVQEFGSPGVVAAGFAAELACCQARRVAAGYLGTGPLVGVLWLLVLAPPGWWHGNGPDLWSVVPPLPVIGFAALIGALVLAATGRLSRWLYLADRHVVDAASAVIAAALLADLVLLALAAARPATPGPALLGALAAVASVIRLCVGVAATARCRRVRRALLRL